MSASVGYATMQVIPSLRGMDSRINSQLGVIDRAAAATGRSSGRMFGAGFASNALDGLDTVGGRITSFFGTTLKRGAQAGALAVGAAFAGGIRRLMGLEDAASMLEQMGLNAQQSGSLMDSLLDTLRGTPFALDQGASALANFVSSGMALNRIPGIVEMVTDAAAFGKAPLDEVADIFNRIGMTGRVTNRELQLLTQRNIPAYNLLASAIGVTEEALFDMASSGQLTADLFFDAWAEGAEGFGENNIRMAGAAQAMGDTTRGAWMNMLTAASRFGARLAGPIFGSARQVFGSLTDWIDGLGDRFGPFVEQFVTGWQRMDTEADRRVSRIVGGARELGMRVRMAYDDVTSFIRDRVIPPLRDLTDWVRDNREGIGRFLTAFAPAAGILGGAAVGVHAVRRALQLLAIATPVGVVLALATGFIYAWQNSETFRDRVTSVIEWLEPRLRDLADWFTDVGRTVRDWWNDTAKPAVLEFADAVETHWPTIESIAESVGSAFETAGRLIGDILGDIASLFGSTSDDIDGASTSIEGDLGRVLDSVETLAAGFASATGQIRGRYNMLAGFVGGDTERMKQALWDLDETVVWMAVSAGRQFAIFRHNVRTRLDEAIAEVRALPGRVVSAVGNLGRVLYQAGRAVIGGFFDGLRDRWTAVQTWLSARADQIRNLKGPLSKDRRLLVPAGQAIMDGLAEGMERRWGKVAAQLAGYTHRIAAFPTGPTPALASGPFDRAPGLRPTVGTAAAGGPEVVQVTLPNGEVLAEVYRRADGRWAARNGLT